MFTRIVALLMFFLYPTLQAQLCPDLFESVLIQKWKEAHKGNIVDFNWAIGVLDQLDIDQKLKTATKRAIQQGSIRFSNPQKQREHTVAVNEFFGRLAGVNNDPGKLEQLSDELISKLLWIAGDYTTVELDRVRNVIIVTDGKIELESAFCIFPEYQFPNEQELRGLASRPLEYFTPIVNWENTNSLRVIDLLELSATLKDKLKSAIQIGVENTHNVSLFQKEVIGLLQSLASYGNNDRQMARAAQVLQTRYLEQIKNGGANGYGWLQGELP